MVLDQSERAPGPIYIIKPDKTRPASLLNNFKNIPQGVRLLGVRAKVQTASEDMNIQGKQAMPISILQK